MYTCTCNGDTDTQHVCMNVLHHTHMIQYLHKQINEYATYYKKSLPTTDTDTQQRSVLSKQFHKAKQKLAVSTYKLGVLLTYCNYHNLEMNPRLKKIEQQQQQLIKIKDAVNIMEEILKKIGQVEQEVQKIFEEAPQINDMQLIIEWTKDKIQKENNEIKVENFEQIKETKELILKLEQLQAINIEQEMQQVRRRMENVRYKAKPVMDQMKQITHDLTVRRAGQAGQHALAIGHTGASTHLISADLQQTLNDFKAAIDEAGPILQDWKKKFFEIQEMAKQVRLHMQKEMDEIQQEMQQLQEQAKIIKDKAQNLQQQTELHVHVHVDLNEKIIEYYLWSIREKKTRIYENIEKKYMYDAPACKKLKQQCAQLQLLQITLIIQMQMQWIQEQAKIIERQTTKEWDVYYMTIACLAACRSKDPRTPVS